MSKSEDQKILKEAKSRFTEAFGEWTNFFKEARMVLNFVKGDQWDHQLRNTRESAGQPCITTNMLPAYIRQITNESRQNCPAIQIDPKDDGADQETAELLADMIRGIEQHSGAATAYDNASWYAATTGLGFFRVISEYESDRSFDQKLVIQQIDDPETVLMDPNHKKIDGSDCEYVFILSIMTKDEYLRNFGETKLAKEAVNGWSSEKNDWVRDNEVIVAEYYWKDYTPATLYQVYNTITFETIESTEKPPQERIDDGTLMILNSRPTTECTVRWAKLNDKEILEQTVWPGKHIPVVAVKGDEIWINGKREIKGAVKDAIDSQRAFNYFFSSQAELLAMAPKAPFIGEVRQFKNFEHIWRDANVAPSAYLPYNSVSDGGAVLPPPMRQTSEVPIQAAMALCGQARDNIKSVFGIFDASLGAQGNETSGKAILARTAQSHTTTYHFYDNLVKSISQCGNILVEAIPTFYPDTRTVQLIKRNGQSSVAKINDENGRDVSNGTYGVVVETGPSYATRRQDSVSHMISLGGAYPQAMPLIADLIASESDWPGSKQIANRLRMALPPEIQQAEAATGQGVTPAQQAAMAIAQVKALTAQVQSLTAQHQQADALLHQAMAENKLLKEKSNVELIKASQEAEIKRDQMKLDEEEMVLSYKIKLQELELQKAQMKLQEAKMVIEATDSMHSMENDLHDRTMKHHAAMVDIASQNIGENGPEGLDKSFTVLSGPNVAK